MKTSIFKKIFSPCIILSEFIKSFIIYKYYANKLKDVDYFDYKKLVNPKFNTPNHFTSVCLYGNYKAIAKLKKSRFHFLTEYLEHGASLSQNPEEVTLFGYIDRPFIKKVYTFANARKAVIEEYLRKHQLKREVFAVGPYIQGVDFFKTKEQLLELKQKYGRILLVFPSHSIENLQADFNADNLVEEILRIKDDFDSVFVCMYWKDALDETKCSFYEKYGFKIVTAGHRSDPHFLNRFKDLIFLSTHTMSNNWGTHIGYSICLNKPHYLYHQEIKYKTKDSQEQCVSNNIKNMFNVVFGKYTKNITPEQIELVEKYWGTWKF
ncbi:MAG: hypothetical protein LBU51_10810 [Bacteroidales bacterium]|jgi:hypothetical protein|nr:hypothetical protein [Bacteroidales bacterium]